MVATPAKVQKLRELNRVYSILFNAVSDRDNRLVTQNRLKTPIGFEAQIVDYEQRGRYGGNELKMTIQRKIDDLKRKAISNQIPIPTVAQGVPEGVTAEGQPVVYRANLVFDPVVERYRLE